MLLEGLRTRLTLLATQGEISKDDVRDVVGDIADLIDELRDGIHLHVRVGTTVGAIRKALTTATSDGFDADTHVDLPVCLQLDEVISGR